MVSSLASLLMNSGPLKERVFQTIAPGSAYASIGLVSILTNVSKVRLVLIYLA